MNDKLCFCTYYAPKTKEETYSELKAKLDVVRNNQERIRSMNLSILVESAALSELAEQANAIKKQMHMLIDNL